MQVNRYTEVRFVTQKFIFQALIDRIVGRNITWLRLAENRFEFDWACVINGLIIMCFT